MPADRSGTGPFANIARNASIINTANSHIAGAETGLVSFTHSLAKAKEYATRSAGPGKVYVVDETRAAALGVGILVPPDLFHPNPLDEEILLFTPDGDCLPNDIVTEIIDV